MNIQMKLMLINGNISLENFNQHKTNYTGRLSYYNLYFNNTLTHICNKNCSLCYDDPERKCIVCNNDDYLFQINKEKKYKLCFESIEVQTETSTEKETDEENENPTETPTETPKKPLQKHLQ